MAHSADTSVKRSVHDNRAIRIACPIAYRISCHRSAITEVGEQAAPRSFLCLPRQVTSDGSEQDVIAAQQHKPKPRQERQHGSQRRSKQDAVCQQTRRARRLVRPLVEPKGGRR